MTLLNMITKVITVITCLTLTSSGVHCQWSWGSDTSIPSPSPSSALPRSFEATPVIPLSQGIQSSSLANTLPQQEGDRSPRFLGLNQKLCSLGLGINCKRPYVGGPNRIPGGHPLPLPVRQPIRPSISLPVHKPVPEVIHQHTHTHIHHSPGSNNLPAHNPGLTNIAHIQPDHHVPGLGQIQPDNHVPGLSHIQPGHHVPGLSHIQPGHHVPGHIEDPLYRPQFPAYREECTCIHASYCSDYDVIARSNSRDISDLIDARTRISGVGSNSTSDEEESSDTTSESISASETSSRIGKVLGLTGDKEEKRARRDAPAAAEHSANSTRDAQGRRLNYIPGVAGCGAAYVCCRNPQLGHVNQQRYVCGQSQSSGIVGRIKNPQYVNGDTEFGEYPWHVAILNTNEEYICGGALIDDRHILTAAHCINNINPLQMKIRLGDWDVSGQHEFYKHVEIPVSFLVAHPQFYAGNLQNDIAVIRMQNYVDFNAYPHITPVCLPEQSHNYFVGQRCHSSGWGKNAFGNHGQFQTILKEVELPVVEHHQCEAALRQTRLGYQFSLHQGMLCAGGEDGKDTCQGDGGGPLVCEGRDGRSHLAGLVSWGIGCGEYGLPGVYVNVGYYLQWIETITRAP